MSVSVDNLQSHLQVVHIFIIEEIFLFPIHILSSNGLDPESSLIELDTLCCKLCSDAEELRDMVWDGVDVYNLLGKMVTLGTESSLIGDIADNDVVTALIYEAVLAFKVSLSGAAYGSP
jgi:hypothetical protein